MKNNSYLNNCSVFCTNLFFILFYQGSDLVRSIFQKFFWYLQFVLLFASFVLIFEEKQLILVAYIVPHYRSSQMFSLKKIITKWQKVKQIGDIWKNFWKMLQTRSEPWSVSHLRVIYDKPKSYMRIIEIHMSYFYKKSP